MGHAVEKCPTPPDMPEAKELLQDSYDHIEQRSRISTPRSKRSRLLAELEARRRDLRTSVLNWSKSKGSFRHAAHWLSGMAAPASAGSSATAGSGHPSSTSVSFRPTVA